MLQGTSLDQTSDTKNPWIGNRILGSALQSCSSWRDPSRWWIMTLKFKGFIILGNWQTSRLEKKKRLKKSLSIGQNVWPKSGSEVKFPRLPPCQVCPTPSIMSRTSTALARVATARRERGIGKIRRALEAGEVARSALAFRASCESHFPSPFSRQPRRLVQPLAEENQWLEQLARWHRIAWSQPWTRPIHLFELALSAPTLLSYFIAPFQIFYDTYLRTVLNRILEVMDVGGCRRRSWDWVS